MARRRRATNCKRRMDMADVYNLTAEDIAELELGSIDPSTIDCSELAEFRAKSQFINTQHDFEVSRVYLRDFIGEIFERPMNGERNFEPFEERGCDSYLKWAGERDNGLPHDYSENQFTYNPIVFYKSPRSKKGEKKSDGTDTTDRNTHKVILKDDWKNDSWLEHRYFALTSPITYIGKRNTNKNARMLYAFAIDLDDVGPEQLQILWNGFQMRLEHEPFRKLGLSLIPVPNMIVSSGHGLHLYYILRTPVALYRFNVGLLQQIIQLLYTLVFFPAKDGKGGTSRVVKLKCHGIFHSFRLPDTRTKPLCKDVTTKKTVGVGARIEAWKFVDRKFWTLGELVGYWAGNKKMKEKFSPKVIMELERGGRLHNPRRLTRAQALKAYGKLLEPGESKGHWVTNRAMYDSWLRRCQNPDVGGVKFGHRFYCVLILVANAMKCDIPYEELERDALALIPILDKLSPDASKEFTENDVKKALSSYGRDELIRWRLEMISAMAGIEIKRVKRNRRKLSTHLSICRATRDVLCAERGDEPWDAHNGRKHETVENSKNADLVRQWREKHPDNHNKAACARDLSMSRTTVTKWWKLLDEPGASEQTTKQTSSMSFDELRQWMMENLEPVRPQYQMELTSEEMMSALTNPDDPNYHKIHREVVKKE